MGLFSFGGDSTSHQQSTQVTQTTSGLGRSVSGDKATTALDGGTVIGAKAQLAPNYNVKGNLTLNAPIDNSAYLKVISDTTAEALAAVASATQGSTQAIGGALQTAQTATGNVTDGGAAQASKTMLYLAGILMAGLALFFYFRR